MKRLFDFSVALLSLILFSPLLVLILLLIRVESKGNPIFKQQRIGKHNSTFTIYKFRTMYIDAPNVATHLIDDPQKYVTKVGKFLRRSSLDELPQLINILKGEMSFVGPRPALYNQYDLIEMRTENRIDQFLPGLTGWAQINGRDDIPIEQKVELDHEYAQNYSFLFDIKIIILTLISVSKAKGIRS